MIGQWLMYLTVTRLLETRFPNGAYQKAHIFLKNRLELIDKWQDLFGVLQQNIELCKLNPRDHK